MSQQHRPTRPRVPLLLGLAGASDTRVSGEKSPASFTSIQLSGALVPDGPQELFQGSLRASAARCSPEPFSCCKLRASR